MELLLTDEQRLLQDSAAKFLDRIGGRKHAREWRRRDGGFDAKCLREIGELGWLAMLVPAELGGMGCGPYELALLLEQAGRALAPEPIAVATLAAAAIADSDNETARATLLAATTAGQALIVPALQEATWDSDATTPATTVDAEATRINGHKDFVPAASAAAGFLVNARNAKGLWLCYVTRDASGLDIHAVETMDGRPYGRLTFKDTPVAHMIAGPQLAPRLVGRLYDLSLVALAAELLGVMAAANDMALDYLRTRKQFGKVIGSFQALQHRAVDNYILIESTRSLLYQVCQRGDALSSSLAAALKSYASGAALTVTKSVIQLHGAIGFTEEYDAGLYLKRAMWLSAQLGNETVQRGRFERLADEMTQDNF
jgi:alkylation response protein AidB-like acyl-CoA dehydrogenase